LQYSCDPKKILYQKATILYNIKKTIFKTEKGFYQKKIKSFTHTITARDKKKFNDIAFNVNQFDFILKMIMQNSNGEPQDTGTPLSVVNHRCSSHFAEAEWVAVHRPHYKMPETCLFYQHL